MSTLLGDARIRIRPDMTGFENDAKSSIGGTMAKVAGVAAGALAAVGVGQFFGDAIRGASDLNETLNKSNVIFGDNAGAIEKWASGAAKSVGLSKAAALEAAAGLGNMLQQLGYTGDAAAKASTDTVKLAADLGSFNNLETGDVLDRISAAMRGEFDSLQALIPNINAARVEQEALAMTGKNSAKELTAQEKATATLAIIQKDGAAAANDFAETQDGLANKSKTAGAQFADLKAKIGEQLLPTVQNLMGFISDKGLPAFDSLSTTLSDKLGPAFQNMKDFAAAAFKEYQDNKPFIDGIVIALGAMAVTLGVLRVATAIATGVQILWNAAMLANPIGVIVILLAGLVAAIVWAYKENETFRNVVDKVWSAIKGFFSSAWNDVIKPIFGWMVEATINVWKKFEELRDIIGGVWPVIERVVRDAVARIVDVYLGMVETIIQGAADAFGWVPGLGPKLKTAADEFGKFRNNVNDAIRGINDRDVKIRAQLDEAASYLVKQGVNPSEAAARVRKQMWTGGYTGDGGKFEPMGTVHGGEYVFTKEQTSRIGLTRLEEFAQNGYARGGLVVSPEIPDPAIFRDLARQMNAGVDNTAAGWQKAVDEFASSVNSAARAQAEGPSSGSMIQGPIGSGPAAGGIVALGRWLQSMGAKVTEHPAFGGVKAGAHSKNSRHYIGRAIDVNTRAGTSALEQRELDRLAPLIRARGFQVIWRAPNHFNHLHAQYDQGGLLPSGGTGVNLSGRPERVLDPRQTEAFEAAMGRGFTSSDDVVSEIRALRRELAMRPTVVQTIHNPIAEPASQSAQREAARLALLGGL